MVNLNYHYPLEYNMKHDLHLPIHFAHNIDPKSLEFLVSGLVLKNSDHGTTFLR